MSRKYIDPLDFARDAVKWVHYRMTQHNDISKPFRHSAINSFIYILVKLTASK